MSKGNILIIDDEVENIEILKQHLLPFANELVAVDSAKKALEALEKHTFHLIFLDFKMPEMDGLEFLKELRGLKIETPVIAITAFATESISKEAFALGVMAIIGKPYNEKEIKDVLMDGLTLGFEIENLDQQALDLLNTITQIKMRHFYNDDK